MLREITAITRRQGTAVTAVCHDADCNIIVTGDHSKSNTIFTLNIWVGGTPTLMNPSEGWPYHHCLLIESFLPCLKQALGLGLVSKLSPIFFSHHIPGRQLNMTGIFLRVLLNLNSNKILSIWTERLE